MRHVRSFEGSRRASEAAMMSVGGVAARRDDSM
jgi:hypothetical protein